MDDVHIPYIIYLLSVSGLLNSGLLLTFSSCPRRPVWAGPARYPRLKIIAEAGSGIQLKNMLQPVLAIIKLAACLSIFFKMAVL